MQKVTQPPNTRQSRRHVIRAAPTARIIADSTGTKRYIVV
jgi:hypothetical protein